MNAAARALRLHLLSALGLPLAGCWAYGTCEDPTLTSTVSLAALAGDTGDTGPADTGAIPTECPTDEEGISELFYANGLYDEGYDAQLVSQDGQDCTYSYKVFSCCGYGRPYLDPSGAPVEAESRPGPGWADGARADIRALTAAERAVIGAWWRKNALAEHSSIAGFHRFALDLLAHGAPAELIAAAQRGASQELRHALDCFALASAYLGTPVGPAPMDLGGHAVIARDLAELAAWTARDGAIGETLAAHLAERALAETTDPAVRAVLETIVRDETEHARIAWETLRWAIAVGGEPVRRAVRAVFAGLTDPTPHDLEWSPALAAHGVPSRERESAEARVAIAEVVLPVAEALLAQRAA